MQIIVAPIGYIMSFCYNLIGIYGWTVIAFTILIKLITLPIGIMVQKNSIKMVKMQPMIDELKRKYPDKADKDQFMEEQIQLFKREKYSAGLGCLPMLIQIPIIIGIIYVIYNPLKHLLGFNSETISTLNTVAMSILGVDELGPFGALTVVELVKDSQYTGMFSAAVPENVINAIMQFDTYFMGVNLSLLPTLASILVIIPILSTLSALILCLVQNRENVLQQEQGVLNKWGMTIFLVLFSLYFTFVVPAGVGLYWICSNVFAIIQIYILNWIYDPKKYIDYEYLEASKEANRVLKEIKRQQKAESKIHEPREKKDYKRFLNTEGKKIVFYSEKSGFYKYFQNVIDEIINKSDIAIHYITSDPNDSIFNKDQPQIIPYYIGEKKLISLFMKMDSDIVVMTTPDLNNYYLKKSLVRKDTQYIFMPHWLTSVSMIVQKGAVDNFDTVFCVGPHWVNEIREAERIYNLRSKNLVECGYGVIESLTKMYEKMGEFKKLKPQILIGPSWQEDNIMDSCVDGLLESLLKKDYKIIVRPHPEWVKRYPNRARDFQEKYKEKFNEDFIFQTDFSSNNTVFESDVVITDWSNVAYEFSFATKKPSLFVNTTMKVMNTEYIKISTVPLDITLRDKIGHSINVDEVEDVANIVEQLIINKSQYKAEIERTLNDSIFNFGNSGIIGALYIISTLRKTK